MLLTAAGGSAAALLAVVGTPILNNLLRPIPASDLELIQAQTECVARVGLTSQGAGALSRLRSLARQHPSLGQDISDQILGALKIAGEAHAMPLAPPPPHLASPLRELAEALPYAEKQTRIISLDRQALRTVRDLLQRPLIADEALLDGLWLPQLDGSELRRCSLFKADLVGKSWKGGSVAGSDLTNARFAQATLADLNGHGSRWVGAILSDATLRNCRFPHSDFRAARLDGTRWIGAATDLDGADFSGARLRGAHFQDIDLRNVLGLTEDQLAHATWNLLTKFPPHLAEVLPASKTR